MGKLKKTFLRTSNTTSINGIHRFKLSQIKNPWFFGSILWDPKFYIGCIRINFKIEFSLSTN
jgi:hypothetical protein